MKKILIADDHEVTRRGVREILSEAFEGVEISEAANGSEVIERLPAHQWDLILLDVMMPNTNILTLLEAVRATHPTVPILVVTSATELEYVVQTMKRGANGLIHKHRASDELLDAIKRVVNGGNYLHSETASEIAATLREEKPEPLHKKLSERELEIFCLIARGLAVKEIAADLSLSDKTVATYLARIREKTGLSNHVVIARYALQHRLVE